MAVVGEAHILVKAITTGFDSDLRRQLRGLSGGVGPAGRAAGESIGSAFNRGFNRGSGNMFEKVAEGLKTVYPEAENARLIFRRLVRMTYTLGTGFTALIGGVSALVGGLVALVAAAGRAAPALAGLASAALQTRLAFAFASFALNGVNDAVSAAIKQNQGLGKSVAQLTEEWQQLQFQAEGAAYAEEQAAINLEKALEGLRASQDLPANSRARREAELAYKQADLAYRQAKDKSADLNKELEKGQDALNQATGSDPYAGLTESQKVFAQQLVELKPKLDDLREAVASGFLPVLGDQINKLVDKYFPSLEQGFKDIGTALGLGTQNIFDNFLDENTKSEVNTFLSNLSKNIPLIGEVIGELGEFLLKVFNDADGIGTQFLTFIRDTLIEWNEYLDEFGLESVFGDAYATGSRLFGIIGNILNGLGDFFTVLNDSGAIDNILDFFEEVTGGFASLVDDQGNVSAAGRDIGETFAGLTSNFGPVATFLGQIVTAFLNLGANPAIGEFFEKLTDEGNAANWENVFQSFADAAPALGDLIVTLGDLFSAFADEGAPTAFFETLQSLIQPIATFFGSDAIKPFIDTISRGFAIFSAVFFVLDQIKNVFLVIVGNLIAFITTGMTIWKVVKLIGGAIRLAFSANPIGFIINAIAILITALITFFTQTEVGRKMWADFMEFLSTAIEGFGRLFEDIWNNILSFFQTIGTNISESWDGTVAGIRQIWDNVAGWFEGAFQNLGDFFEDVWENVTGFFKDMINGWLGLVENFINFFINGLNNLIGMANGGLGFLGDLIGQELQVALIPNITLPRLASGGIVAPSAGGTLAQIAEAGRPERVEPLDENGLSKRDYAILNAMRSGGAGMNINVYPSAGMDERELAEKVSRRIAFEIRRGNI